jgi:hypothetical protein
MASDPLPLDISDLPELLHVAEEVNATAASDPARRGCPFY